MRENILIRGITHNGTVSNTRLAINVLLGGLRARPVYLLLTLLASSLHQEQIRHRALPPHPWCRPVGMEGGCFNNFFFIFFNPFSFFCSIPEKALKRWQRLRLPCTKEPWPWAFIPLAKMGCSHAPHTQSLCNLQRPAAQLGLTSTAVAGGLVLPSLR